MELIDQHTKNIMEGCKERARQAGLRFQDETLEYIVTNRDLLELSPKLMIPTLYDYWVHDVEVLKEKGRYELYPHNPYETVINTRPAISFYNDNNPDWLNVMIFYHVLAHIDFFQNNLYFRHTWDFDLTGQALSDKRLIAKLRSEKGRWVDYVIEFARAIDNLVDYHGELSAVHRPGVGVRSRRLDYYFDLFLQQVKKVKISEYVTEIERYNQCTREYREQAEQCFFAEVNARYPEFEAMFEKHRGGKPDGRKDLMQFLLEHSEFLNKDENKWMLSVIQVIRKTSLYFQPQIRTKFMNEGWASYWHEKLFLQDERIGGHEVDFARVHAGVTSLPRVGLNPYAIGMRLFQHLEEMADKGRLSNDYQRLLDADKRKTFDSKAMKGQQKIFEIRENLSDFTFINTYVDQDFVDRFRLFVVDRRLNEARMVWQYYVKSRKAGDYREMLLGSLYHPPVIRVDTGRTRDGTLCLVHRFEGKPLVREFIANTMMGIEFLWGGPVQLETSEVAGTATRPPSARERGEKEPEIAWRRVLYEMKDRKLTKLAIG
ncbi:SpoVR family protein [Desulfuromonas versatilis]|uniref:SpoVR family protein n=1 Tax=Desulfuromonas versatilis TaxID=2802975 RepID=A0ABN6DUJ2_9BACT|nr:SpoVR family protein [Desulfuromonas versatilis]BCR03765.1 SpoVR family protein [Desulfuromonas versatilis]